MMEEFFTVDSTVGDVVRNPVFDGFGRLLFPVDINIPETMTLREVSTSRTFLWYSDIHPDKTVEIVNELYYRVENGERIYYPIYSEDEIRKNPERRNTGLFFLRGNPKEKFAVLNAGGGFFYVAAMHDSFPHALELCRKGYNAFVMIYRPETPWQDLGRAICFIEDHAEKLGVDPCGYSLWGGSAGARMAAVLGNSEYQRQITGRELPRAGAVIMQYTGYDAVSRYDAPTYACVGTSDGIAWWGGMKKRLQKLNRLGVPTEFHAYSGLRHGFGIGTGTAAEGWIDDAVRFWEKNA
ncbi:MAG: alpha/beta hydrolase [Bilifractor sp.]|jgi:acetyl esterase/lipase